MTTDHDANRLLMGGAPGFKFDRIGDTAKGRITGLNTMQVRDFVTGVGRTYPDGNPIMQIVATIQPDDGDETRVFFKPAIRNAVRDAVKAAGANGLEIGGELAVRYTADEAPETAGLSPKKLYVAQYKAPAPQTIGVNDLLGDPNEAPF